MNAWQEEIKRRGCLRIGHRGAAALEPQNTLRSFQRAIDLGVDAVEFDVRWTVDRELVVVHSEDLAETTNGHGLVQEHTLAELRRLDAGQGERIPTFDELLDFLGQRVLLNVDLKVLGCEEQVVRGLHDHKVKGVLVNSLDNQGLLRVHALDPSIATAISYPEDVGGASTKPYLAPVVTAALTVMRATMSTRAPGMIRKAEATGIMLYHRLVTPQVVETVHRNGWFIGIWTVDDAEAIARIRSMGVDSITTNRPDLFSS